MTQGRLVTAVLADNAVTTAKIQDSAVTAAKVAADVATQAELDAIAAVRGARVFKSASQSIATSTTTAVSFDSETFDTNALHDPATNNSRVLLNKIGLWRVAGQVRYQAHGTGSRQATIRLNGATFFSDPTVPTSGVTVQTTVPVDEVIQATAITDYVELLAWQDSGGNLNVLHLTGGTFLVAHYLGSL